jgi:multimeric flavodoxin WrbA
MLITLISGSPRQDGNSEKILKKAEEFFHKNQIETEFIKLRETIISPCIHCNFCSKNNYCTNDETANKVNEILKKSDALLVASPVYFGGITAQLKALIDKTLPLRRDGFKLKGKIGAAITSGGSRNGGQELAINDIHAWMLVHGMVLVGDNNHFGGTVHNPLENDEFGNSTSENTFSAIKDLLERLK